MATNPPFPPRVNIKIEELRKSSIARRKEKEKDKHVEVEVEAKRESLPSWSDSVRRIPNVALRSALFGTMRKGAHPYVEQMEVSALGGVSILYTGALLDQGDLDVWAAVLHLARMQELGEECRITAYRLLKVLGKTDTGKNRRVLDLSISRLKATALQVKVGRYAYEGSLIHEVYRDHHERSERIYVIRLNPKLGVFFREDQFTDVDLSIRYALRGKPLAKWIHGFYSSHARPYDLKIETLHRLCRSQASSLIDFKKDLLKSLEAVKQASANVGRPFSYLVDAHLIQVKTTPSASQKRHLDKKR